jgi:hypothetical protein
LRFTKSGIGGNNHIPKELGIQVRKIPLGHGKRKYICRIVKATIVAIKPANTPVPHYRDGQFAIDESQDA